MSTEDPPADDQDVAEAFDELDPEDQHALVALGRKLGLDDPVQAAKDVATDRRTFLGGLTGAASAGYVAYGAGKASAQSSNQAGTIGTQANPVDLYGEDLYDPSGNTRAVSDIVSGGGGGGLTAIRDAADFSGATGGDQIQAAINDLPARGGMVFVPAEGPDTVTNADSVSESGVWEVTSTISTAGKNSVRLFGASVGWVGHESGTALICSDGTVGTMLEFTGGFLDTLQDIRLDAAGNATSCVDFGGGNAVNDFQAQRVMVHDATSHGFTLTGNRNFWIDNCWTERNGGAGVNCAPGTGVNRHYVWIKNLLSYNNSNSILISNATRYLWLTNLRSDSATGTAIQVNASLTDAWFSDISIYDAATDAIQFAASSDRINVNHAHFDGNSNTRHAINRASGTITDLRTHEIIALNPTFTNNIFSGLRSDANANRLVINGMGFNDGDPNSTGSFATTNNDKRPIDGEVVRDYTNNSTYIFAGGSFRQLTST